MEVPLLGPERSKRDSRIVLHDLLRILQHEVAHLGEVPAVHQIGRALEQAVTGPERLADEKSRSVELEPLIARVVGGTLLIMDETGYLGAGLPQDQAEEAVPADDGDQHAQDADDPLGVGEVEEGGLFARRVCPCHF